MEVAGAEQLQREIQERVGQKQDDGLRGELLSRKVITQEVGAKAAVSEQDICQAGLAATKRAYEIYRERGYAAVLLVAALRGDYHLTDLAGADLIMSIAPGWQKLFVSKDYPREPRIACPVPADVIERLEKIPEFVRAYEPDGMAPSDFMAFGATQRTLGQFVEVGWKLMESFR